MRTLKKITGLCKAAWILVSEDIYRIDQMVRDRDTLVRNYLFYQRRPAPVFLIITIHCLFAVIFFADGTVYLLNGGKGDFSMFGNALAESEIYYFLTRVVFGIALFVSVYFQNKHYRRFKRFRKHFEIEELAEKYAGHS